MAHRNSIKHKPIHRQEKTTMSILVQKICLKKKEKENSGRIKNKVFHIKPSNNESRQRDGKRGGETWKTPEVGVTKEKED
jgi:hypothetical protein